MTEESRERAALCVTFERVGPGAPTLCSGRSTGELLAYLLVGERRFVTSLLGLVIPPLARRAEARMYRRPWLEMVELLRTGPAWLLPGGRPGDGLDFLKLFVHHEDVLRARRGWTPRPVDPHRDEVLWRAAIRLARLAYQRSNVGVVLRRPDGASQQVRKGTKMVTVVGEPGELVLHMCGRSEALVSFDGDPVHIAASLGARPRTLFGGASRPARGVPG
ncbi:TIGR03085 family metal-binding protein [Pseudonocardia acaciae]|uniref:TIGR03085 family metal-binding protein n=1 Tax=Pseudonocardia acaciae TaxID=551276 RepID=UPI000686510C|nr:TIGR03085 family metal-binding protein [Pseudonocardia acaciae]